MVAGDYVTKALRQPPSQPLTAASNPSVLAEPAAASTAPTLQTPGPAGATPEQPIWLAGVWPPIF